MASCSLVVPPPGPGAPAARLPSGRPQVQFAAQTLALPTQHQHQASVVLPAARRRPREMAQAQSLPSTPLPPRFAACGRSTPVQVPPPAARTPAAASAATPPPQQQAAAAAQLVARAAALSAAAQALAGGRPMLTAPRGAGGLAQASHVRMYVDEQPASGLTLMELPAELVQEVADWLPTFGSRAGLRALCSRTRPLEWRRAAPFYVKEELSGFGLGDLGCAAIAAGLQEARNGGLKELCLGGNNITDDGVEALAAVLASGRTSVRRLSLRDNDIRDRGAQALASALRASSCSLEEVDLWGNSISDEGQQNIVAAASSCEVFLELPRLRPPPGCTPWNYALDEGIRAVLFDWVSQVHESVATTVESVSDPQNLLLRTYSHIDAYLARRPVQRSELELVGLACALASSGLLGATGEDDSFECEELATWLAYTTEGACTGDEVRRAAHEVREELGSSLHQPTVYTFLRRYLRQTGWTEGSFSLANYLVELAALDASFLAFRPQAVAAAAAVLCRQYASQGVGVRSMPNWRAKLLRSAGVDLRQELAPCAALLSRLHATQQPQGKQMFVHQKFTSPRLSAVARLRANPPADISFFEHYMIAESA